MPPNPSNDLKRQRHQRRRHDYEHALRAPVMPPTPSDDLAKLAGRRPNDGRLALRPLRMVAPSPSIGAGRSARRHPVRDRSLGYGHAGRVAQRPRYAPKLLPIRCLIYAIGIEIIGCAAP
jgi:hypothetical protein